MVWPLVITVAVSVIIVAVGGRRLPAERVRTWMAGRNVPVNGQTRQLVERELHRARRWRSVGAAGGLLLGGLVNWLHALQSPDVGQVVAFFYDHLPSGWPLIVFGYLVGAMLAESRSVRPHTSGHASVVARQVSDYVPANVRQILLAAPFVLSAIAVLPMFVPVHPSWPSGPSVGKLASLAVAGGVALVAGEALARKIVSRPQRLADPALIRADDALRACSASAAVSAATAIQLFALSSALWSVGTSAEPRLVRWTLPFLGLAAVIAGLWVWIGYGMTTYPPGVGRKLESVS